MRAIHRYLLLTCLLLNLFHYGRATNIDSLQQKLNHPTLLNHERVRIHLILGKHYLSSDPTKALAEVKSVLSLEEIPLQYNLEALNIMGQVYYIHGDHFKGLTYHLQRLEHAQQLHDTTQLIASMNDVAKGYFALEDGEKASNYWIRALYLAEQIKDSDRILQLSLDLVRYYRELGEYFIALQHLDRIEKIYEQQLHTTTKAEAKLEKGLIYFEQGIYTQALKQLEAAYTLSTDHGASPNIITILQHLGLLHGYRKEYSQAFEFMNEALRVAKQLQAKEAMGKIYEGFASLHEQKGDTEKALYYYKKFKKYQEIHYSEKRVAEIAKMQIKQQVDEKEREIQSLKTDQLLQEKETNYRQTLNTYLILGLGVLVIVMLFYAQFKQRSNKKLQHQNLHIQQQKQKIERQKENISIKNNLLERTNQKITDSIRYANTIQRATLPHKSELLDMFEGICLSYIPKDIVSGDFYWAVQADRYSFIAVADCTGHGVPGGFMSMIGQTILSEIVQLSGIYQPSKILEELDQRIRSILKQDQKMNDDGMDIVICRLEKEGYMTHAICSSAKRPIFYIPAIGHQLQTVRGTNRTIGGRLTDKPLKAFKDHGIYLKQGGMLYLTTDGFVDQKGFTGSKYGSLQFKSLLDNIASKPLSDQQRVIQKEFEQFKADGEQIDDVTILGVQV